ncbi:MAG TPA: 50S ribosomal protein L6 [Candidatus Paceibacterota bacterium]
MYNDVRFKYMSKIGKKPILIPKDVQIKMDNGLVSVKGPKGELKRFIPGNVDLKIEGEVLMVTPKNIEDSATWGLASALIKNMIKGVSEGFETVLEFQGVGYKAVVKGNDLEMGLGFSHPVTIKAPDGITFKTEKSVIRIQGIDNELIGKTASEIRSWRRPEPYKGSGIRYQGEIIKRKAGKKAVATG